MEWGISWNRAGCQKHARDRQNGGAGVGLAIAERAVHLHGGNLRATNAPGSGLVIELDLPLARG